MYTVFLVVDLLMQHFVLNEFSITKVTSRIDAIVIRNK